MAQLTMWINFTSFRILLLLFFYTGKCINSKRQKALKNIRKCFLSRIFKQILGRHSVDVMQKKIKYKNSTKSKWKEERRNGSFAYKWTGICSKASYSPDKVCQSTAIENDQCFFFESDFCFFFLFSLFNLSARQIFLLTKFATSFLCKKLLWGFCVFFFFLFLSEIVWSNPIWILKSFLRNRWNCFLWSNMNQYFEKYEVFYPWCKSNEKKNFLCFKYK